MTTLRVSIANVTPERAARFFHACDFPCTVVAHIGVDATDGIERGATVTLGGLGDTGRAFKAVRALLRAASERSAFVECIGEAPSYRTILVYADSGISDPEVRQ